MAYVGHSDPAHWTSYVTTYVHASYQIYCGNFVICVNINRNIPIYCTLAINATDISNKDRLIMNRLLIRVHTTHGFCFKLLALNNDAQS